MALARPNRHDVCVVVAVSPAFRERAREKTGGPGPFPVRTGRESSEEVGDNFLNSLLLLYSPTMLAGFTVRRNVLG